MICANWQRIRSFVNWIYLTSIEKIKFLLKFIVSLFLVFSDKIVFVEVSALV